MKDYLTANKAAWNARLEPHLQSSFYDVEGFLAGRSSLNAIELALLGDVKGLSIAHLQCHFGQDSLSLARMGAKVTGFDLSDEAIAEAKRLNEQLDLDAQFVCTDVLSIAPTFDNQFECVFTSYGVIGWHPDISRWARTVSRLLKRGGRLVFAEFHPAVWMFNDDFTRIDYSYFNGDVIIDETDQTYTDDGQLKESVKEYCWNHGLAEVFNALRDAGLEIQSFDEYDYSPYDCLSNMVKTADGYQIKGMEGKLPLVYSLTATKL